MIVNAPIPINIRPLKRTLPRFRVHAHAATRHRNHPLDKLLFIKEALALRIQFLEDLRRLSALILRDFQPRKNLQKRSLRILQLRFFVGDELGLPLNSQNHLLRRSSIVKTMLRSVLHFTLREPGMRQQGTGIRACCHVLIQALCDEVHGEGTILQELV